MNVARPSDFRLSRRFAASSRSVSAALSNSGGIIQHPPGPQAVVECPPA